MFFYRRLKDLFYKLKCYFFPRQKWLLRQISNSWVDKDYIIELVFKESIIHFVEEEKCFEFINWEWHENKREQAKVIKEIYNWFKIGQKELQEKIDKLMEELYGNGTNFAFQKDEIKTAFLNKLETELYDTNTKYMIWLIENRNVLWT